MDALWRPVVGAEVRLILDGPGGGTLADTERTNPEGEFYVEGWSVSAGDAFGSWRVEATAEGYGVSVLDELYRGYGVSHVGPIFLFAPVTVSGRVLDENGDPVTGARIRVVPGTADWSPRYYVNEKPQGTTGNDGHYEVSGLVPGVATLGVSADGFADLVRRGVHLTGQGLRAQDLVLQPERKLVGVVVDEEGKPIAGAVIDADFDGFWRRAIVAYQAGRFEIAGLPVGWDASWSVHALGYRPRRFEGHPGASSGFIVLTRSEVIEVIVEPAPGAAPARIVRVEIRNGAGAAMCGTCDVTNWRDHASRRATVAEVGPLEWHVFWEAVLEGDVERGVPSRLVVHLDNGARLPVKGSHLQWKDGSAQARVVAPIPGGIEGRVVEKGSGEPVPFTTVLLNHFSVAEPSYVAATDETGRFFFENVAPKKRHQLTVENESWRGWLAGVGVEPGEISRGLVVSVKPPSRVSGRVTINGETPAKPIVLGLCDPPEVEDRPVGGWNGMGTTDEQGSYSLIPRFGREMILVPKLPSTPAAGGYRRFSGEFRQLFRTPWPWRVQTTYFGEVRADVDLGD